jgi:hypothetical protein
MKTNLLLFLLFVSLSSFAQKFNLGDHLSPKSSQFKLIGTSSSTGVTAYQYIGKITDAYFFNRKIGDILVGFKNGMIVTTIYLLIPEKGDVGVPKSTLNLVQKTMPFPLAERNGMYGANIDNMTLTLSRTNNAMTFNKDRIMFMTSVKNSLLKQ